MSADAPAVKTLWQSSFADSPEYIDFAMDGLEAISHGLAAFDGNKLVSMLFLLKAVLCLDGEACDVRYVYGVATETAYRKRGILRELDAAAAELARSEGAKAMVLIPAEPWLFGVYQRLGYRTRFYGTEGTLSPSVQSGAVLLPCSPGDFLTLRRENLRKRDNYCDFYPELCEYRYYEYLFPYAGRPHGEIYRVESGKTVGYTVGYCDGKRYVIQETDLSGWALAEAAGALKESVGADSVTVMGQTGKRFPLGMIKLLDPSLDKNRVRLADLYMNLMFN